MRLNYNIGRVNMRAASLQLRLHFRCLLTSSPQEYVTFFQCLEKLQNICFPNEMSILVKLTSVPFYLFSNMFYR